MLTATVWGGAGEHGRSCYHIERGGVSVLLDCGVKKTDSGEYPLFDAAQIPKLSTVFLSHAHEDHSIGLPLLYRMGYRGDIWTTRATTQQLPTYFAMWSEYVQRLGEQLPYEAADMDQIRYRYLEDAADAGAWFEVVSGVKACWGPSGHLPGSVWILLDLGGKRLFYSGDYTSESSMLRADLPNLIDWSAPDLAIVDAAYGARAEVQAHEVERLIAKIREVLTRQGHILMPVPIYGRGQELLTLISEAIPEATIACESSLLQGFHEIEAYADWLRPGMLERVQQALICNVTIVHNEEERAAILAGSPSIIFAPDGMLQTPIAQEYYYRLANESCHALLFTGHLYAGSFGAQIWSLHNRDTGNLDYAEKRSVSERCEVQRYHYKIHQGLPDVARMLEQLQPKHTILVHADKEKTDQLMERMPPLGFTELHSLTPGERLYV